MKTTKLLLVMFFSIAVAACGGGGGGGGGTTADTTPPTVSSTSPANNASGVAVNAAITATFNEAISAPTITSATFTLNNGVTGTVTYSGTTATFTPTSNLAYSTAYTATITTGVKDAAGNAMTATKTWAFTTGIAPDTTPPTVSSTSPANNATGIAVNAAITATFSENMSASTISSATFTLNNGVTGAVTYSGTTATFTPSSNLAYSTAYTATITTGIKDAAGNALASNYTWTFTTGTAPDTTPPTVSSTSPANNATGVAVNAAITATFSENMDTATISTATFSLNNGVTGAVTYSGTTTTFTPSSNLAYSTAYTATITTAVKDAAGNTMAANKTWSFTTGAAPDTTPPTVSSTSPANSATGIAVNASITATFSENMDTATISSATFTLNNGVTGTVTYSGTTATFTPSSNLAYSTAYTATITTAVKDAAGNAMAATKTWSFTTGTAPDFPTGGVLPAGWIQPAGSVAPWSVVTGYANAGTYSLKSGTIGNSQSSVISYTGTFVPGYISFALSVSSEQNYDWLLFYIDGVLQGQWSGVVAWQTATFPITAGVHTVSWNYEKDSSVSDGSDAAWIDSFSLTAQSASTLNDTGITASQCYQTGSDVLGACGSAGAIALNNAQDGMAGRDVTSNSNSDGKLGFSFASVAGGCVQDNVTGLMWEVKTADGGLRDWNETYTNYSAAYNPSNLYGTTTDASGFVAAVNATNLCGHSDWRLPTADELQSIVDYGVAAPGPAVDATWFPNTQGNMFWTASPYAGLSGFAWDVSFGSGYSGSAWITLWLEGTVNSNRSYANYVRLVRAGQSPTPPRYIVSTDGQEVTDSQTNLIWRRCSEGMVFSGGTCTGTANTFTRETALQRAAAQASSTGIAWRLPNVKELSSIADKSRSNPAIDVTAFPATPASWFWSATPSVGSSSSTWYVDFNTGYVYNYDYGYITSYVRLVRDK